MDQDRLTEGNKIHDFQNDSLMHKRRGSMMRKTFRLNKYRNAFEDAAIKILHGFLRN